MSNIKYQRGFGNHFTSEAKPDTLPAFGHSPQKVNHGLYAEQLSGTAFTAPRAKNQRSWLYRIRPSVNHAPFRAYNDQQRVLGSFHAHSPHVHVTPQQLRWDPLVEDVRADVDFVDGMVTLAGAGDTQLKNGLAIHAYTASKSMGRRSFYNSDGDFLIVPQRGALLIRTEFGLLEVPPLHIAVVQRGIKFSVDFAAPAHGGEAVSTSNPAFGYICETFKGHFELPDLGLIGANGLANPEDFETPVALYDTDVADSQDWTVINKFMGRFFCYDQPHSPYDVVGFSGNYVPYRYDLAKFNTIGSISYDHPDPSIFTVLTCPTDTPGTAVCDFVIFPARWLVAEHTFRPPYFHRNCMSEFMGNIVGVYDAKASGFVPGGASLHNMNSAHGPDGETFDKASSAQLRPVKVGEGSMSFMFESAFQLATTKYAIEESGKVQQDYWKAWSDLKNNLTE
ncbi:probable homogentisate 1,2-dioxygenase [Sporisorium reilianum f. sp. reilianum]|uniref:homogentisate 1,2-dioxygenase n=1 Tax=Sporisorium reilianum f. sp. reilianum TaxID=72559 RepID=A0A2N8U8X6_9BASI|nr:probable homogentisate 1,2-dioxygenase [Sporisorium reilianum f. sp. reilianum]